MRISDWSSDVCSSDLEIAKDLGVVGIGAERRVGVGPQPVAGVRQGCGDTEVPGDVGGGAQVLRHEAQGAAGGELAGEHLLLQPVLGAVVAAGGGVQHVDAAERVEPAVGADDDRFGGSGGTDERRGGKASVRTYRYRWT